MLKFLILVMMLVFVVGAASLAALAALAFYAVRLLRPMMHGYAKNELHRHYFGRDLPEHEAPREKPASRRKRRARPLGDDHHIVF
jgi:hypothetical protein